MNLKKKEIKNKKFIFTLINFFIIITSLLLIFIFYTDNKLIMKLNITTEDIQINNSS